MSGQVILKHVGGYAVAMATMGFLLTGCGEVAYSWGGGNDQLLAAKQACTAQHGDKNAYDSCMSAKGWSVAHWDDDADAVAQADPAPAAPAPTSGSAVAMISTGSAPPATAAPVAVKPADPMKPITVTSWWKMGGSDFKATMSACVDTLGPEHQPDTAHHTITRAVLSCMNQHGWHGI